MACSLFFVFSSLSLLSSHLFSAVCAQVCDSFPFSAIFPYGLPGLGHANTGFARSWSKVFPHRHVHWFQFRVLNARIKTHLSRRHKSCFLQSPQISVEALLRELLKRLLSDTLAVEVSWSGRGGTVGLKGTRVMEVLSRKSHIISAVLTGQKCFVYK